MSIENSISGSVSSRLSSYLRFIPVILSALVGIVLLIAVFPKVFAIDLFIRQIRDYEIISNPLLIVLSAWGLVIFECMLGTALLINYRPKIAVPTGSVLFLIFIAATGWAWHTGSTDDCGCFGSWVERTPKQAMLEDVLFLAALLVAWKWNRSFKRWPFRIKEIVIVLAFLAGLSIPIVGGPILDRIGSAVTGPIEEGHEQFVLDNFTHRDLSAGRHIIYIISTDCSHCRAEMEYLNMLATNEDLPEVIALTMNNQEQIDDFVFEFDSAFELFEIPDDDFWRLLGDGNIPRTILVADGMILKKWDFAVPAADEIKPLLGN